MKNVVIQELTNYRNRSEKRFLIMTRLAHRNGLNHVFPARLFTRDQAIEVCNSNGWTIEAIGDFYEII